MSLAGKFAAFGDQAREAVNRGGERLRQQLEDAESALRRRMRLHPGSANRISSHPEVDPASAPLPAQGAAASADQRKPIVSVNGKDVDERELGRDKVA